ncbi:MAG: DUF1499 domain-containing protein [Myxococcota bacterium]|nr:DUF1499 domain-containing protein [Myxococcota bacterium]
MAEGKSGLAKIAYYGGLVAVCATALGILGIQVGLLSPISGFYFFSFGCLVGGAFTFLMGLVALVTTRNSADVDSRKRARIATLTGAILLGVVVTAMIPGREFPSINDITTNLADPPQFASADRVPAYADFDMNYPPEFVEIVAAGYPDLATLELGVPPTVAYERSLETARQMGWEISDMSPNQGRFDATDTTRIFRFVDDITVRVRPLGNGSAVDIRSRSRVGRGDLGANAIRIRQFTDGLGQP